MRSSTVLSASALCLAVLAGCGGSEVDSGQSGTAAVAGADLKARRTEISGSGGTGGSTLTSAATAVPTGRLLASNCFNCHGTDGHPNGGFDSLAGDSASEIVKTLKEFLAKSPEDGGIMRAHAMGYTEEQMWQIGTYFASRR